MKIISTSIWLFYSFNQIIQNKITFATIFMQTNRIKKKLINFDFINNIIEVSF